MKHYLSFGAGVNSVALHLLMLDEKYDFESVFINHGTDYPETYEYFDMFQEWLVKHNHKPVTEIKPVVNNCTSLIERCKKYSMLPHTLLRWCTADWKVVPFQKYVEKPCFVHIGIDTDEAKRAKIATGEFYYKFENAMNNWKDENRDKTILHMMQTQDDKFIIVTIWYRDKIEGA